MTKTPTSKSGHNSAQSRDERLKAALKANLAKRKSQRRARAHVSGAENEPRDGSGQDKDA
ncbi:MAG: hypothetical protein PVI41_03540 [Roseobacter sp.]|jgi:hypothetical protein